MNFAANRSHKGEEAFTLIEALVAAILTAIFFASLFELNAMCLRYIDASKESLAALQSVQDRLESLRNRNFTDLTKTDCTATCSPAPCTTIPCVHDLMATAANPAPIAARFTEVVTVSNYPATTNGVSQYTRTPDSTVTTNLTRTDPTTDLAKVDVQVTWITTAGSRDRTEQTSCIVANGSKK